jgi:C4-dicarboxylate-specific signal transduction histidine kinase/cytochrome b561
MTSRNDQIENSGGVADVARYAPSLQILHWTLALLVSIQLGLIPILRQLQSAEFALIVLNLHRSCGTAVWLLVILRLLVGLRVRSPKFPAGSPAAVTRGLHGVLLGLLFVQPILGVMSSWARGEEVMFLGLVKLPPMLALTADQGGALKLVHRWTAYILVGLIGLHFGEMLLRRAMLRVPVLEPMLPAPPPNKLTNRIPFTVQLAFCCGLILVLNTAGGVYGANQYKSLSRAQERFDQTQVSTLDDLRTSQLKLKSLAPLLVGSAPGDAQAFAVKARELAANIEDLRAQTTDAAARVSMFKAETALTDMIVGQRSLAGLAGVDQLFQQAVDRLANAVLEGRLQMRVFAAKGHDLIILILAPTVIFCAVLAFLLSRSVLSALSRARAVVQGVEAGTAAEDIQVKGSGEFAELMRDVIRLRRTVEARQRQADAREMEQQSQIERERVAAVMERTWHRSEIERQQSELRLQELQSELLHISRLTALGEMSSALAHELNQPLSAIANYLSGVQRLIGAEPDATSAKVRDGVNRAVEQALRAGDIIRRLREFVARGETAQRVESVANLVEETSALALVGAKQLGVRVSFKLDGDADLVLVDKVQFQQVLHNLIRNAVEAMAESERRELSLSSAPTGDRMLEICVSDTGSGLADEVLARLFQPFVTTKRDGMGVGLSICRTIVEAQGGEIWTSPNPGGGTVFHITVPRADADEIAHAE